MSTAQLGDELRNREPVRLLDVAQQHQRVELDHGVLGLHRVLHLTDPATHDVGAHLVELDARHQRGRSDELVLVDDRLAVQPL